MFLLLIFDYFTHFRLGTVDCRFYGAFRQLCDCGDFLQRKVVDVEESDYRSLYRVEHSHSGLHVHFRFGADARLCRGILHRFGNLVDMFLVSAAFLAVEFVVGNAIEPSAKARQPLKGTNASVGFDKGFLCQVVGEVLVAHSEVEQKSAQLGLVCLYELAKCATVVAESAL